MLDDISKFKLSNTCLDVFLMNYLCPLCRNQPLMCPGRCTEIITGCVSPLNQVLVQADVSLKLTLCKSIASYNYSEYSVIHFCMHATYMHGSYMFLCYS